MKMTNVKKFCAWICTAALLIGTTANAAPMMYEDYNETKTFAETAWKTISGSTNRVDKTVEACIDDGKLVFPFSSWKKFVISKEVDSAQSTGNLIFEMRTQELNNLYSAPNGQYNNYPYNISFEELDEDGKVVRSDTIAMNAFYSGFAVNGTLFGWDYISSNTNLLVNWGALTDIRIIFDCENGKIYPQMKFDYETAYKNIYNAAWEKASGNVMNAYKYDRITINVLEANQTVLFDNIKLYDEAAPNTPYLDDDFNAEGLSFANTGWNLAGADYLKYVNGGKIYYQYLKNAADYMPLSHDVPAEAKGVQVIELDYDLLNSDGGRIGVRNGDTRTIMFCYNGSNVFTLHPAATIAESKYALGAGEWSGATHALPEMWTRWREIGDAFSIRVVFDYDNKVIDLYYKTESGVYANVLSLDATDALTEGVCVNSVQSMVYNNGAHAATSPDIIRIDNFKSYYIDEKNEVSKPIFVNKTTGEEITSLVPGSEGYVTVSTLNKDIMEKDVSLIAGIFDKDDKFIDYINQDFVSNITLIADNPAYDLFTMPYTVPADLPAGSVVRLYAWNNIDDMIPLADFTELSAEQ